jgi:GT2 family glycosyltransferase
LLAGGGNLRLRLPSTLPDPASMLVLMLDGSFAGMLAPSPDRAGALFLDIALPRHQLAGRADLLDPRSGRSVLPAPLDVFGQYGCALHQVLTAAGEVSGSVSLASWFGSAVMVELAHERGVLAQVLALRAANEAGRDAYTFTLRLPTLVPVNGTLRLQLRVGGRPAAVIELSPADMGYAGYLDGAAERVQGWVVSLGRERRRTSVDIWINGAVVATVPANALRNDVRAIGIETGRCGFSYALPKGFDDSKGYLLAATLAGTGVHLCGSPLQVPPNMQLEGYFDSCHGTSAHGWAFDRRRPKAPVLVEAVLADGRVLGQAEARLFRGDLLDAGLRDGLCAFKIDLGSQFMDLLGQQILVRVAGTTQYLQGSPRTVELNPNLVRFARRQGEVAANVLPRLKRRLNHAAGELGVSIVMPMYNTPRDMLMEAIASVHAGWCDRWELICVNDCSTEPHVAQTLHYAASRDARIRVLSAPLNGGIAAATNYGIRAARYPYVAFMDHDDCIEPDAVWQLIRAARQTGADLLYSDEATTDESIAGIADVKCRPAFSYDYYLSHPYFVHLVCVRTSIAREVGGWDQSMTISADVDFVLRVLERSQSVAHVPAVLYRWRTHGGSAGHASQGRVMEATRGALQRHLDRCGTGAVASDGVAFNQFSIAWPAAPGRVLIVIPTKNKADLLRTAIGSIERTAAGADYRIVVIDHQSTEPATKRYLAALARTHAVMPYEGKFNYSRMNNMAVRAHGEGAEFVLFLNNDVEALHDGWLDRMRRLAARKDVGCVGALLLYADRRVQHAGVILGFNGSADHAFKFNDAYLNDEGRRNLGYNCSLTSVRDFSAVTAACMMMRREVFEAMGGFDEDFAIGFNDTDLCLRLRERGLKVLYDGGAVLFHHESATRSDTKQVMHPEDTNRLLTRWSGILDAGDPFYSPLLSEKIQDHVLREDTGCRVVHAPRVTRINLVRPDSAGRERVSQEQADQAADAAPDREPAAPAKQAPAKRKRQTA